MERAGVELEEGHAEHLVGLSPAERVAFIISKNIKRRHLTKEQQADLIVAALKAGQKPPQDEAVSKGGRGKVNPVKQEAIAAGKKHGISKATVERSLAKAEGRKPKARSEGKKPKPKRKTKRQKEYEALLLEQERQEQAVRQQWVAEGRDIKDYEAGIDESDSAVWEWRRAWGRARVEEERQAWLRDHSGNPLPEHLCSLSDAEDVEYHRWQAQRETPSDECTLALKSEQHLIHLKTAWDAADQDARLKFLAHLHTVGAIDGEPEAA
jgi:hypothetical protein